MQSDGKYYNQIIPFRNDNKTKTTRRECLIFRTKLSAKAIFIPRNIKYEIIVFITLRNEEKLLFKSLSWIIFPESDERKSWTRAELDEIMDFVIQLRGAE